MLVFCALFLGDRNRPTEPPGRSRIQAMRLWRAGPQPFQRVIPSQREGKRRSSEKDGRLSNFVAECLMMGLNRYRKVRMYARWVYGWDLGGEDGLSKSNSTRVSFLFEAKCWRLTNGENGSKENIDRAMGRHRDKKRMIEADLNGFQWRLWVVTDAQFPRASGPIEVISVGKMAYSGLEKSNIERWSGHSSKIQIEKRGWTEWIPVPDRCR